MGGQGRNGKDRMRTIWTPEMDRYFIDLMLEQVRKGNRIDDHLFSKRAWSHMTTLFNAKFGFQYEKDVLKNRHKTLRNLYKGVKNLLEQKGFSWDEERQMVTADNKVWDDYIKVHQDARSYRIRTVPYYNDLCEINENASFRGEGNNCSQNAKVDTKIPEPEMGSSLEDLGYPSSPFDVESGDRLIESSLPSGTATVLDQSISVNEPTLEALHEIVIDENLSASLSIDDIPQPVSDTELRMSRPRTYWQPPMDRYFIDLMLDHVQKGNQVDGLFYKQAWMEMLASFNAKFGFNYDVDILKNRHKTLRRQYNVIKNLLEMDGFVWDDTRQLVTADDCIWQECIKTHNDARQYMTKPVPYYKDLCIIYKDLYVDEKELHKQDEDPESKHDNALKDPRSPSTSFSNDDLLGKKQESADVAGDHVNKHKLENASCSSDSKKARIKEEGMVTALRQMATAVSSLADKRKDDDDDSVSIEAVVKAIQALPDMDEELVFEACDYLEDEKKAKTFLALDIKLRKKWLIRKLRSQQVSSNGLGQQ